MVRVSKSLGTLYVCVHCHNVLCANLAVGGKEKVNRSDVCANHGPQCHLHCHSQKFGKKPIIPYVLFNLKEFLNLQIFYDIWKFTSSSLLLQKHNCGKSRHLYIVLTNVCLFI